MEINNSQSSVFVPTFQPDQLTNQKEASSKSSQLPQVALEVENVKGENKIEPNTSATSISGTLENRHSIDFLA